MVRTFPIQAGRTNAGRPADILVKSVRAMIQHRNGGGVLKAIEGLSDPDAEAMGLIIRAATTAASTTQSGWAAQLAQTAVADFVVGIGPFSSGGQKLLRSALVIPQEPGEAGTSVPSMLPTAAGADWVTEGAPIPMKAFQTSLITLKPGKIAAISAFTREMTQRSSFEQVLRRTMEESVGLALDATLFSTAAAGVAPAGLRNGISSLTPATGGGEAAMMKDLGNLAGAIAGVANDNIAFAADPVAAVKLKFKAPADFAYPIFTTAALPTNTVQAIALNALAVAIDPDPNIQVAESATLHFDDAPTDIGIAGSPSTVAAPARSLFQMDSIAMRIELGVDWELRAANSTAFVTGVTW